ncbi:MAG: hypothetical protein ACXVCY_06555 [Pseudobdellovibrionaceae bacterium]
MLRTRKLSIISLLVAVNISIPVFSNAEENPAPATAPSAVSTVNEQLNTALQQLKENASSASAEFLNSLLPKATQYAKDVGYAALCNEAMARKNHDDMSQIITFIYKQTDDLVNIVENSFSDNSVTETALAIQGAQQQAIQNSFKLIGNREKIRSTILLAVPPLQTLIKSMYSCEYNTLHFPNEILMKMDEVNGQLEAISKQLASSEWAVSKNFKQQDDSEKNVKLDEKALLRENVKANMTTLKRNATLLQLANRKLNRTAVEYLTQKNQNEEEDLERQLESLK